jgi:hypothetical protein
MKNPLLDRAVVELSYTMKDNVLWRVEKSIYTMTMKEGPWALYNNNNDLNESDEESLT